MKKNLILFSILVILLGGTYLFQERRTNDTRDKVTEEARVFEREISQIRFRDFEAIRKDKQWWAGETLLSHNQFNQLLKKLSSVMRIKKLQGDPKTFFTDPLKVEIDHVLWSFGDMALDRKTFYLSNGTETMLATIEGDSQELTDNPDEIPRIKLDELKTLLTRNLDELRETQLFRFYQALPLEKIYIEAEGRLPFELDLKQNKTNPAPIPGVEVHSGISSKFVSLITQMTLKKEIPFPKNPAHRLGEIRFQGGGKIVKWELWLLEKKSADSVIIDPDQKRAFLMVGGTLKGYFIQNQDYWDKKVIPPSQFKSFDSLKMVFLQGATSRSIQVLNREPLDFEGEGKLDKEKLRKFLEIIFNLGPFDQADRVSLLSKSERQQILSEEHLRVQVQGQELLLWKKPEEVIVVNLTQGFKAHFALDSGNISTRLEDMIK